MQDLERLFARLVGDLGFVDMSALTLVALFFLLGLCKGMVWQVGQAVALLGSYAIAGGCGPALAEHVFAGTPRSLPQLYLAYVAVFLLAFLVLSAGMRWVQVLVQRAGLGVFDRLAGGVLGVGTGGAVVLGMLAAVLMFGQRFPLYAAVQESRVLGLGRSAISSFGDLVPVSVQAAFLPPQPASAVATRPLRAETPALDHLLRDTGQR